jgi:hypothetical protein
MGRVLVMAIVLLGLGIGLTTAPPLQAQAVYGLNVGAAVPNGPFADIASVGFGGAASAGAMMGDSWMLKGTVGFWSFTSEEVQIFQTGGGDETIEVESTVVPLLAGFRKFWGESKRFFTGSNFGIYFPTSDLEELDPKFGIGPQIGYRFPSSESMSIDLIAEFNTIFIGDENPLTNGDREYFDESSLSWFSIGLGITFGSVGGS